MYETIQLQYSNESRTTSRCLSYINLKILQLHIVLFGSTVWSVPFLFDWKKTLRVICQAEIVFYAANNFENKQIWRQKKKTTKNQTITRICSEHNWLCVECAVQITFFFFVDVLRSRVSTKSFPSFRLNRIIYIENCQRFCDSTKWAQEYTHHYIVRRIELTWFCVENWKKNIADSCV